MTTFGSPTFTADYQGLCSTIADTLNRQDLVAAIPNFVSLATSRLSRDVARVKHPGAIVRAQASTDQGYITLPGDFIAMYQLMDQDTSQILDYLSPDQTKQVLAQGWDTSTPSAYTFPQAAVVPVGAPIYYTIIGQQLRVFPTASGTPIGYDLWYYAQLAPINALNTTNWVLTTYPDVYLYGALVHTAPYLKADDRLQIWEAAYQKILADIEVEADRSVRSQSKLVAARRSF
jgi:hypothetical protein